MKPNLDTGMSTNVTSDGASTERPARARGPLRPIQLTPPRARVSGLLATRLFQLGDFVGLAAASLIVRQVVQIPALNAFLLLAPVVGMVSLAAFDVYRFERTFQPVRHLLRVGMALLSAAAFQAGAAGTFHKTPGLLIAAPLWVSIAVLLLLPLHLFWLIFVDGWRQKGMLTPNLMIVGATPNAEKLIAALLKRRDANVLGIFDDRRSRIPDNILGVPVLGDTRDLANHRLAAYADRIVIAVPRSCEERIAELVIGLTVLPNEIMLLVEEEGVADAFVTKLADIPLARLAGVEHNPRRAATKRAQDIVLSALALVAAAPILIVVAIAIKLDSKGPVFFRQRRHGFNNEEITVWKFRSMRTDLQDNTAAQQVMADDHRVTRVGRFIRKTSLDELPQLLNVLSGEMSLVGPRPHAVGMKSAGVESARLIREYAHRHRLKPGLTGWAAIQGSRGPVDTVEDLRRRLMLDLEYIERQSFWLDLWIMLKTLPVLIGDRSAVR